MGKEEPLKDFASFTGGEGDPGQLLEEAQKIAAAYDGRNESELLRSVYARAAEGKRNGTLTNAQIDAFCAQLAPMLDAARRKKLYKIAAELKKM